jgi:N-formylglutamate amidohydrolase
MVVPRPRPSALADSPRTRGGLGLVPARIAGAGAIWRQRLSAEELSRRIESVHRPYHAALDEALKATRARFGLAILLDCHSMPPRRLEAGEPPVVLGDRYGTSIAPAFAAAAEEAVRHAGYEVGRNSPYAGGHITACHGRPEDGIHALQIEIDRSLYLGADLKEPGPGFDRVAALIADVAAALTARALEPPRGIAAE